MTIETYPEMNTKIVEILRWATDDPALLYAAQRIEELEAEVERLQRELHDEQTRRSEWEKMYNQAVAKHATWEGLERGLIDYPEPSQAYGADE